MEIVSALEMRQFKTSMPCEMRVKGKVITDLNDKMHWNDEDLECVFQDDDGCWHLMEFDNENEYKKHKFDKVLQGK